MRHLLLLLLPVLATGTSVAATATAPQLPDLAPVEARYRVTVNGVPAGTAATVEVKPVGGARHQASFKVQNRFFSHHEVSVFDWQSCRLTAQEYRHDFHGLGIDRQSAIHYDWQRKVAIESRENERRELPLAGDIYDGLNMAMLARCRLREGARSLDFAVLYRGERKEMQFAVTGQERVETPAGTFDTVVVERQYDTRFRRTRVWVAPALDWFMVRFEHVENPAARGSMVLTEFQLNGTRIPATPAAVKRVAKEGKARDAKARESQARETTP